MAETTGSRVKDRGEQTGSEQTRAGGRYFVPRVDIFETDKELTLYADMPGVPPEDVELRYEQGELRIHGKLPATQRAGRQVVAEYEEGDFFRVFAIHESIDGNKIEATCKNGVLVVHLPKVAAAQPRQIQVRAQ